MKKLVTLILFTALMLPVTAQAKLASQVVADYYNALKRGNYAAAATYFDKSALKEFRQMMGFVNQQSANRVNAFYKAFFGPEATRTSVEALSDQDYFSVFLSKYMSEAQKQGSVDFKSIKIIGEVREGSELVHVVARNNVSSIGIQIEVMEVISLKKRGKRWSLLLTGRIRGMAETLRSSVRPRR